MRDTRIVVIPGATLAVLLMLAAAGRTARAETPCLKVAQELYVSCRGEARADRFLAMARCENLPLAPDRQACRAQALSDRREALGLCADQLAARRRVCGLLGEARYGPDVDPANFPTSTVIDNPFLPLVPGRTMIYTSTGPDGTERIEVTVTPETKVIMGVTCRVVRDTATVGGLVVEDTLDWYAQDGAGNVWYFGEESKQYEEGELVDLGGSWKAGRDLALPGIVMPASPAVGQAYRQEYAPGDAEDVGRVLALGEAVTVPYGSFAGCLKTEDSSPLEPDAVENKYYAPGIGQVLAIDLETGEREELVDILPH